MDTRLAEACHTGNLGMLHSLLQQDEHLLHRFSSSITATIDNPLHIAASLGHTDFANEIMIKNPYLALDLNPRGLSALHLASAHGHLEIVKLLISRVGSHLCFLKDKDGRLAIHIAAMKGSWIGILKELIQVCPQSARTPTYQNESILHLAFQFSSFQTLQFLVNKLAVDDDIHEVLNLKDDKGNTILHHAVATRQLQSVELLLSKGERVEVNAMNHKGLTALDVLLDSPSEDGDLTLGEMICAAGGKVATELDPDHMQPTSQTNNNTSRSNESSTTPLRRLKQKTQKHAKDGDDNYSTGQLMVVATIIATITFQAGLNPPGGFTTASSPPDSNAFLGSSLNEFMLYDMIGLFASFSIILILISVVPRKKKKMMKILVVIMWVAVFFTALAFSAGIDQVLLYSASMELYFLALGWFIILKISMLCAVLGSVVYLLRKVGWWRKKEGGDRASNIVRERGHPLWCIRIGAVMIILLLLTFIPLLWIS